jgi:hypothetical protein
MAKKPKRPTPGLESPEDLPQRFDVWEVDARQLDAAVPVGGETVRPWMTAVVSRSDGQVLAFELAHEAPGPEEVWGVLLKALRGPEAGEPHRPTEVRLREEAWRADLAPRLEALNVQCSVSAGLETVNAVFGELAGRLADLGQRPSQTGLLDMPGMTPEAVGSFFDAAALFYKAKPWARVGERPVEVACPRFESGPWYAILMGQGGMARGLVLYDSLETLQRIQRGDLSEEENARISSCLAVVFGEEEDLPTADIEALRRHGWRVASRNAYPSVYRMEPGLSMRPPLAWELTLLEGCLRALPEFVRKKTRRLGPLTLEVPTGGGELPLVLSWTADAG